MKESRKLSSFCSVNSLENFEISEIDFELQKDEDVPLYRVIIFTLFEIA